MVEGVIGVLGDLGSVLGFIFDFLFHFLLNLVDFRAFWVLFGSILGYFSALGAIWGQPGPKARKRAKKAVIWSLFWLHFGGQNRPKWE